MSRKVDIEGVLRSVEDHRPGWRKGLITFGPGGSGCEGLLDGDNVPWEIVHRWPTSKGLQSRKRLAEHVDLQLQVGYQVRIVDLAGESFEVERLDKSPRLWDGLQARRAWQDSSCYGSPWQWSLDVTWTYPGAAGSENITLYIRHRSWSIDSDRCLWTGQIIRCDSMQDPFAFLSAKWSPNLLPTLAPQDAPPPEPSTGLGGILAGLFDPARKPRPEVGFLEEEGGKARTAIVERAERWLREHGRDEAMWQG